MDNFREGDREVFWDGKLEIECPGCGAPNHKLSERSYETCVTCHRWYNWRHLAWRVYAKAAQQESAHAAARAGQIWRPTGGRAAGRKRAKNGTFAKEAKPKSLASEEV